MHVINTETDQVSLAKDRLVYGVYGAASIALNGMIFVFGGTTYPDFGDGTNKWQYISVSDVSTNEPITKPTDGPTIQPSTSPLQVPTPMTTISFKNTTITNPTTSFSATVSSTSNPKNATHLPPDVVLTPTDAAPSFPTNPSIIQISSMAPTYDPTTVPLFVHHDTAPTTNLVDSPTIAANDLARAAPTNTSFVDTPSPIQLSNEAFSRTEADNITIRYLVIIISLISVICVCILIGVHYRIRNGKFAEPMRMVKGNVQHNNVKNDINIEISHGSNNSMYIDKNEIVPNDIINKRNKNENGCDHDDTRKEGEEDIVCQVDDTDIGEV